MPCYADGMKKMIVALSGIALSTAACAAATAQPEAAVEAEQASIPFANHGGIRNWRPIADDVLLIESVHGNWYRAEFFGSCTGLRFSETLAFETNADGSFDRFSSVRTRDQVCRVRSLVEIPDPDAGDTDENQ